jgi:hypothetical protein
MNRMLVLGLAAMLALGVAAIAFAATGGETQEERQARTGAAFTATATATSVPARLPATVTPLTQADETSAEDQVTVSQEDSRGLTGETGETGDSTPQDGEIPPVGPRDLDDAPAIDLPAIIDNGEGGGSMPSSYDTEEKRREVPPSNWNDNGSSGAPDEPVSSDDPPVRPDYSPGGGAQTPSEPPSYKTEVVPAPIDALDILTLDSFPPQYLLSIQASLPSGCAEKHSHEVERSGDIIRVTVLNTMPAEPVPCTMIYGMYQININLGSDFQSGRSYTVIVNDQEITFTAE